jgi:hypothetical protein
MEVVYGGDPNPVNSAYMQKDKFVGLSEIGKFEQKMLDERTNNFKYVMQDYDF